MQVYIPFVNDKFSVAANSTIDYVNAVREGAVDSIVWTKTDSISKFIDRFQFVLTPDLKFKIKYQARSQDLLNIPEEAKVQLIFLHKDNAKHGMYGRLTVYRSDLHKLVLTKC